MPSVSKKQQKFMGIVRSIQKGEQPASKFSKSAQDAAKKMKKSSVKKYAKTKHDDLPTKKEGYSMRDLGLSPFWKKLNPKQREAVSIALVMGGNMTGAVKAIEKIKKGLSKDKKVRNALRMANESIKKSVNEKVNKSDLKYQLDMSLDNLGIGTKALIVMKPKGKDFFLKMKSYMYQDSMEAVLKDANKNLDSKLKIKDFKKTRMGTEFIIGEAKRDYKAEYKKFQSSPKAKKYRAELNKYNRQKGTYGNGDGKDASHKGGKIVGFESQSKNRGRAEKSRLRKEINDYVGGVLDEVVNEAGMELKKLEDAIKMFKKKIQKQGRVTNARDEEHLERLMKVYNDMGGRKIKENNESFNWLYEKCWKGYEKKGMKTMFGKRYPNCVKKKKSEGLDEAVYKLKRGSTSDDLDELDALLARAGFKGKPDFNKMTWSIKNKNPKIAKIIKSKGGKKIREGTCGYGIDGKIGEEPAGPNLMKKIKKISKDKEKKKILKSRVKEVKPIKLKSKSGMGKISHLGVPQPSKGVEKLFKIADSGYGKVGGVTVDSMSAGLFKQIYNKVNDDIKQKLNKKNEKQLVRIIGGMWKKFGKNVSIGSSL